MVTKHAGRRPATMKASEFKARCLEVMERVATTGEVIVITKRGKPVAQLGPVLRKPSTLRGFLQDSVRSLGDLTRPIQESWHADRA